MGADPREIIFTSGATEANNMAIKGVAGFYKDKKHVITTQTDRALVLHLVSLCTAVCTVSASEFRHELHQVHTLQCRMNVKWIA